MIVYAYNACVSLITYLMCVCIIIPVLTTVGSLENYYNLEIILEPFLLFFNTFQIKNFT